jgi:hypothetical protein
MRSFGSGRSGWAGGILGRLLVWQIGGLRVAVGLASSVGCPAVGDYDRGAVTHSLVVRASGG